jgi:hypothetical protein
LKPSWIVAELLIARQAMSIECRARTWNPEFSIVITTAGLIGARNLLFVGRGKNRSLGRRGDLVMTTAKKVFFLV